MVRRIWNYLRSKPSRIAFALSAVLAIANLALLLAGLNRRSAAADLALQVDNLQQSLTELQRVDQEGLSELESGAQAAEAELQLLKASFPTLGEPYDLYREAFALARNSAVEVTSVETGSSTIEQTPVGYLGKTTYTLKGLGDFQQCIDLMGELESAGLATLALDKVSMDPLHCGFDVILASSVPASQVDPVEALGDG